MTNFINRRRFLSQTGCGAYVFGLAAACPGMTQRVFLENQEKEKVVAKEKFAKIVELTKGFWAVVSTPFDHKDFTTVCNGGIVAGKDRVLVVESYMNPKGAKWVAEWAEKLAGKWPTDVVITHYHADHSTGSEAFFKDSAKPNLWVTKESQEGIQKNLEQAKKQAEKSKAKAPGKYPDIKTLKSEKKTELDLGGKKVSLVPRVGHTSSDVTIELADPNILYCGDLFFNRMIPNYSDADPVKLKKHVKSFRREKDSIYVPGHGPVADNDAVDLYLEMLDFVEDHARSSFKAGKTVDEAAKAFQLNKKFKDWYIFSPAVVPRSMNAWYKILKAEKK